MKSFDEVFEDRTKYGTKIKTDEYHISGAYPIIDQGQEQIAGYTDREEGLFQEIPALIFGDHTRVVKYVDEPFFLGADGVKVLRCRLPDANYRYLYYALRNAKVPDTGYNRHFKWLKVIPFSCPDPVTQERVVRILDKITEITEARNKELALLDELVKARFVEMFGDLKVNPYDFEKKLLKETCTVITGNTPSRSVPEYYGNSIEWIKTDNIVAGQLNPSQASECLSDEGMKVGRVVDEGSILMACIAGSVASIGRVCITDRKVAFNQQINAVIPKEYDSLFLYVMLQLSKEYLIEEINMALKGILSKSKLENKTFIVPPMDQQKCFAAFAAQIDKSKSAIQKSLAKTQTLFDSLMQEYFG